VIEGLSHITLIVSDLDRMERFLVEGLGARKVYDSGKEQFSHSEERFFLLGESDIWIATMKGDALPGRTYNHIAFKVSDTDLDGYRARLERLGVDIAPDRPRVEGEGRSLYVHDFDNHLFELHTGTLDVRLRRYAAGKPAGLNS
jgi:fosfomycin resistance protein FosX